MTLRHHPAIHFSWRVLSTVLLGVAFVVPVYLFVEAGKASLPGQQPPPLVKNVAAVDVRGFNAAVPVLIYHDIAQRPGRSTVTPRNFACEMAGLHRAGFHAISIGQLSSFLHGGSLPSRPVLIAFSGSLGSAWRVADPVLHKYGFRAVAYVTATKATHGFYYLHPSEIQSMTHSGRWDVEERAQMSFDRSGNRFIDRYDVNTKHLPSLEVKRSATAQNLLTRLNALAPRPARLHGFPVTGWFDGSGRRPIPAPIYHGLAVTCPGHRWCATYWSPSASQLWRTYRVRLTVSHLGSRNSGASGTLLASNYAVTVSAGRLRVVHQGHRRVYVRIPVHSVHHLDVALSGRALRVSADGLPFTVAGDARDHGGIGFGGWQAKPSSPTPIFSNLSVEPLHG